jgi:DNA-binding transcriptional regulator YhcF (GntR family)
MLPFSIVFQDGQPAADQLILGVRKAILSGELRNGDAFPSVRKLSLELKISPTTAHKAVAVLKGEGLLASLPGIGMVVRYSSLPETPERLAVLQPQLERLLKEARSLQLSEKDLQKALTDLWSKTK